MEPFPAAVAAQPNQRPNYGSFRARGWTRSLQFGASKCVCRLRRLGGAGRGTRTRHERGDEIWGRRTDRRRTTVVLVCCTSERLSPPEKTAMAAGGDQEPMWNLNEICTVRLRVRVGRIPPILLLPFELGNISSSHIEVVSKPLRYAQLSK